MRKKGRVIEIRRHGRVPARPRHDTYLGVFIDEEDFEYAANEYLSFPWLEDQYDEYLDSLHDYVNYQQSCGSVYLAPISVKDFEQWCQDVGVGEPDDDEHLTAYVQRLITEVLHSDPWEECFHDWVDLTTTSIAEGERCEELGIEPAAVDDAVAPLMQTITDSLSPLFGEGDHTVTVLDTTRELISFNHVACVEEGKSFVWDEDLMLVEASIRQAWLWDGTVIATHSELSGHTSHLAWKLEDQNISRIPSHQVDAEFGDVRGWGSDMADEA